MALIRSADVLVTNQPPDVQRKLGLDHDSLRQVREDLVFVSITGFGLTGERAELTCYDLIAEGYSGIMDITGAAESNDPVARTIAKGRDEKEIVSGLVSHLKETGRTKLLPRILRELKKDLARKDVLLPHVEAASEEEAANAKKMAAAVGIIVAKVAINPSLIRGWRARIGSSLVDVSGKKTLIDLYRSITH